MGSSIIKQLWNKFYFFAIVFLIYLLKVEAALKAGDVGVCSEKTFMPHSEYWQRKRECYQLFFQSKCLEQLEINRKNEIYVCCKGYEEKDGRCEVPCPNCAIETRIDKLQKEKDGLVVKFDKSEKYLDQKIDTNKRDSQLYMDAIKDELKEKIEQNSNIFEEMKKLNEILNEKLKKNIEDLTRMSKIQHFLDTDVQNAKNEIQQLRKNQEKSDERISMNIDQNSFVMKYLDVLNSNKTQLHLKVRNVEKNQELYRIELIVLVLVVLLFSFLIYKWKMNKNAIRQDNNVNLTPQLDEKHEFNNPIYEKSISAIVSSNHSKQDTKKNLNKMVNYSKKIRPEIFLKQTSTPAYEMNTSRQEAISNIYASIDEMRNAAQVQKNSDNLHL